MSVRPISSPFAVFAVRASVVSVVAALAVVSGVACSNISLSSSTDSMGSGSPPSLNDLDAPSDSTATGAPPDAGPTADGAAAPVVGSALCNYGYANDASHACRPDDSSACAQPSDAGPGATDAGGDAAVLLSACHVVQASGRTTQACSASGPGKNGDQCQTGADCATSFECVGSPGLCRHYCCSGDTSCDAAGWKSFCDVQTVASGDLDASTPSPSYRVPVCMPVSECTLLGTDCAPGTTCAIVKDDGTTSCVAVGTAGVGASCDAEHCKAGLTCLGGGASGRICYELCRVDDQPSACPTMQTCTSSAQIFKNPAFGICQ